MSDMTNAQRLARWGCAHCCRAVLHPTVEERRRGTCLDCHHRQMKGAVEDWRAFEDQHADALKEDDQ